MGADHSVESIILFDDVCKLCVLSVTFVIRHDRKAHFRFASLQSVAGQNLLHNHGIQPHTFDSIVLLKDGKMYTHSTAALKIVREFDGLWAVLYIFIVIPTSVRNILYNWIAKNRYTWFGKKETCMVPTPELKARFLE